MIPLRRSIRQLWRRLFPPRVLRIPGKFPWKLPAPLPFGTPLVEGTDIVADGKGGVTVSKMVRQRVGAPGWVRNGEHWDAPLCDPRPGRPGARRPKIG